MSAAAFDRLLDALMAGSPEQIEVSKPRSVRTSPIMSRPASASPTWNRSTTVCPH